MRYRTLGRTGWQVSEIGYGLWGMGSWTGSDDTESFEALQRAVALGCNFFDTAWVYGHGRSEKLLGKLIRANRGVKLCAATKVPPLGLRFPIPPQATLDEAFPPGHIREYVGRSLANLGLGRVDLLQFHGWNDTWADDERWQRTAGIDRRPYRS